MAFLASQERGDGLYDVLVATDRADLRETEFEARNEPARQLNLDDVLAALNEARAKLAAEPKRAPQTPKPA